LIIDSPHSSINIWNLNHRLTSYDAAYLELAMRTALPLATLDQDLRKAASAEGVSLLGL
jgi:predicted nucleic acid-binding protein